MESCQSAKFEELLIGSLTVNVEAADVTPVPAGHTTGWRVLPALLVAQGRNCRVRAAVERNTQVSAFETKRGGAVLMAPGVTHRIDVTESRGGASWWSHISFQVIGSLSLLDFYDVPVVVAPEVAGELGDLNARLSQLRAGGGLPGRIEMRELALRILRRVLSLSTLRPSYAAFAESAERFAPVLAYVEKHLQTGLTRDKLAALAHLSPSRFHSEFKRVTGISPLRYVARVRLRLAQKLLITTDRQVAEVGAACGYADAFHFSRIFKRETGISPIAYRKQGLAMFANW